MMWYVLYYEVGQIHPGALQIPRIEWGQYPVVDRPTVCLDVIALVASSCGYHRSEIEPRVAQYFTAPVATQRGRAERPPHHHPPHAQTLAPVRQQLAPRGCPAQVQIVRVQLP